MQMSAGTTTAVGRGGKRLQRKSGEDVWGKLERETTEGCGAAVKMR